MTLSTAAVREKRLPREPGIYLMKDEGGKIIYIGKAKDLSKRVASYFVKHDFSTKTARLVARITDLEFVVTDNETEAFLLEANLIRRYRPEFNIALKDNNRYSYPDLSGLPAAKRTHEPTAMSVPRFDTSKQSIVSGITCNKSAFFSSTTAGA